MYYTMSAIGKVTKHNLQEHKGKKTTSSIRSISLTEEDQKKNWVFFYFTNLSPLPNFANRIFTVYTGKQHPLRAEQKENRKMEL